MTDDITTTPTSQSMRLDAFVASLARTDAVRAIDSKAGGQPMLRLEASGNTLHMDVAYGRDRQGIMPTCLGPRALTADTKSALIEAGIMSKEWRVEEE